MRNYPYVVVISGSTPGSQSLIAALDNLEIPNFQPERDIKPGENWAERLRAELNAADVVLVPSGPQGMFLEGTELEVVKSRKYTDPAFKVIPVVSSSEVTPVIPDWLEGIEPLIYNPTDPTGAVVSIVKSLIPDTETRPVVTLDELLAEAEALALRLKFIEDQYRHSLILLGISALVFVAGFFTVTYAVRTGAGNPLSGFYQFLGLVGIVVGGISLFFCSLNWSAQYKKSRLARHVRKNGWKVISRTQLFLEDKHKHKESAQSYQGQRDSREP